VKSLQKSEKSMCKNPKSLEKQKRTRKIIMAKVVGL